MQWPRFIEKFGRRGGRNNFVIQDDGVAKLPDAEAKKKSEREGVKFRRGEIFHRSKLQFQQADFKRKRLLHVGMEQSLGLFEYR